MSTKHSTEITTEKAEKCLKVWEGKTKSRLARLLAWYQQKDILRGFYIWDILREWPIWNLIEKAEIYIVVEGFSL